MDLSDIIILHDILAQPKNSLPNGPKTDRNWYAPPSKLSELTAQFAKTKTKPHEHACNLAGNRYNKKHGNHRHRPTHVCQPRNRSRRLRRPVRRRLHRRTGRICQTHAHKLPCHRRKLRCRSGRIPRRRRCRSGRIPRRSRCRRCRTRCPRCG